VLHCIETEFSDCPVESQCNTDAFCAGTDTRSLYFAMLEAGMSVVAVNLPSLWLFFTSLMPEKLVRSVRSMISLPSLLSQRRSDLNSASAAATSGSATHLGRKPDSSSSINSGRPDFPSDLSQLRYHQQMVEQQLNGNPDGQKVEAIAMHNTDGKGQQGEQMWVPQGQIHVEDTVELSREKFQRAGDEFC
jgi:hypothetical protein